MNLNEIAIITLIIAPFIYLMMDHTIKCERKPNRRERRKRK